MCSSILMSILLMYTITGRWHSAFITRWCFDHWLIRLYIIVIGSVSGNKVNQESMQIGQENGDVILVCTYDTSSSYACLFWYRQYANSALDFIMRQSHSSCSEFRRLDDSRFTQNSNSTTTTLTISRLKLSDAAIYYCALYDDHSKIMWCTAVQKHLLTINCFQNIYRL